MVSLDSPAIEDAARTTGDANSDCDSDGQQEQEHEHQDNSEDGDVVHEELVPDEPPLSAAEQSQGMPHIMDTNIPRVTCALLASITTGGVSYAFGLYGGALKKTLHLSQAQLQTISSATFVAGLFSWVPGMFVDRFGTRVGISVGGVTGATSLMLYWAIAKQYVVFESLSVVVTMLSALGVAIFLSCALITGAVFKIISCSCGAGTKGSAVGVAKGFVGLGSGAYASLFQTIRQPATSDLDFIPMCAFFFLVCATIPSWLTLPTKAEEGTAVIDLLSPLHFRFLYGSLATLAMLIIFRSIMELYGEGTSEDAADTQTPNYLVAGTILTVWLVPLAAQWFLPYNQDQSCYRPVSGIVVVEDEQDALLPTTESSDASPVATTSTTETVETKERYSDDNDDKARATTQGGEGDQHGIGNENDENEFELFMGDPVEIDSRSSTSSSDETADRNLQQMLQTSSAWLLLWTCTMLVGGGIVETNNLGQMVESLHFPPIVTSASLSLFSVAQSGGRVATGILSEAALRWSTKGCGIDRGIPRPFFLVVASLLGVLAHTILAVSMDETSFVLGIALSGLAFGSVWPLMVLIVGEIYGTAHVGANYMFYDGFTSAAGTFLLSKIVAQHIYDSHIESHYAQAATTLADVSVVEDATCFGQECFQMTHVIIALLSLTCVGSSLLMQCSTRDIYNQYHNHGR